ncbi:MAG: dihydropteroate synthase [Flavobacteriales bacterium]|nr:dihydropteroate synthase [Flavobacteriales bacterium]
MGILNVTPDSFYAGGRHSSLDRVKQHVESMVSEGVDIIDIGGASSRPGAAQVSPEEELERIIPALECINKAYPELPISVDTYHAFVAREALGLGARIINDITAGSYDSEMLQTIASHRIPYIIMHMQGMPDHMQDRPCYSDVLTEVTAYLSERIQACQEAGVVDVIIDPGFGFGKSLEHNYRLMAHCSHFQLLDRPMLIGISRKSMVQKVVQVGAEDALNGTTALHMYALQHGAGILRVHDVKEAKETILLHQAIRAEYG